MAAPKDVDQQGSLDALQKELEANPFNTSLLSKLAETYANRGDYNNACQLYEKLVRLDEDNGRAWTALGHCYLLKAEYQKCFTAYQKALYTLPHTRDPQLWYGIALLYNKFDTYEYAEPAYQAVLRIDPAFEQKNEVFFKLGQIYRKTAAYDNAVSYLRNSMVGDSVPLNRKVDALCSIGVCYEKQGKLSNAIEIYKEALELEHTNFKTMEYLGWALAQNSKEDEAVEQFLKALEEVGSSSAEEGDIHYLLGRCYLLQKKYPEGQTEFQKAIFKNPNSYIYWCSIGVLYAKASQPQDAFECFIKASNITQEESESWFNMGILYEHCNQSLEAVLAYQRAVTIDSKNTDAAKRKEELQDRSRATPPPDYIHPKFEISDLPFSLQKSEKAKKPSQLPGIEQHKPGEITSSATSLQPETAPTVSSSANNPQQATTSAASAPSTRQVHVTPPAPSPVQSIPTAVPQATPPSTRPPPEPAPKPEVYPGLSFSQDPPPTPTEPVVPPTQHPYSMPQGSSFPGQMGVLAGQFQTQILGKPCVPPQQAAGLPTQYQPMPPSVQSTHPALSPQMTTMQAAMQAAMSPPQSMPASISAAMQATMPTAMQNQTMSQIQNQMMQTAASLQHAMPASMQQAGLSSNMLQLPPSSLPQQSGLPQQSLPGGMSASALSNAMAGMAGMAGGIPQQMAAAMQQSGMTAAMQQSGMPMTQQALSASMSQQAMQSAMSQQAMQGSMPQQTMQSGMPQQAMQSGMPQQTMQSGMPQQAMQASMSQQAMQGGMPQQTMPPGMPQQSMGAGGMNGGMPTNFMGGNVGGSNQPFNPMSGMMNPMGMNPMGMNPFAGMNPMMISQMMQMMYLQQMAMMRSMFGMGRGAPNPAAKPESSEQQNSAPSPSENTDTRAGNQKRKGDALPDTRTKRRG